MRRRILRWTIRGVLLVLLAAMAGTAFIVIRPHLSPKTKYFDDAAGYEASGDYLDAASSYASFVSFEPNDPNRPEAQFRAALCLQMAVGKDADRDSAQALYKRALEAYQQFVKDNPAHLKVTRATVMMGILEFQLEQYKEAVELLRDPTLQARDPEVALPVLRTLAQAWIKMGEYDSAGSVYLQAAARSDNYFADQDYEALGNLFLMRSKQMEDPAQKQAFEKSAVEYWNMAMRIPTVDPTKKPSIREKRDALDPNAAAMEENAPPSTTRPADGAPKAATAPPAQSVKPATPAEDVPAVEPAPAAPPASPAPDPRMESQYPGTNAAPAEKPATERPAQ